MTSWEEVSKSVFISFFEHTKDFVGNILDSNENYMDCLFDYYHQAWIVPKLYKGNSSGLGFVPEYLIFETVKQHLERRYKVFFQRKEKSLSGENVNTYSFFDNPEDPRRFLVQGLKIDDPKSGFHSTDCQHDITYQVKENDWRIRAIIEVKGFVDLPSLQGDLKKLYAAELKNSDCLLAFVGFNISGVNSEAAKDEIRRFTDKENHFFISPENKQADIKISSLKRYLESI